MKTLVLGDTHGRPYWKSIVANEAPNRVIFIGDYFDSYDDYTAAEQMYNFQEIIDWKQSGQSEVIMLIGNHDYHYMRGIHEHYSGYQRGARPAIEQLLEDSKEHMQMCYQMGEYLFTHAGVSSEWLDNNIVMWDVEHLEMYINDLWTYKPHSFGFVGYDPYGGSTYASPIWIRPMALQRANRDTLRDKFIQVVGHTQVNQMDILGKATGGRYHYIDALGTSGEYMIIEDNKLTFPIYKK
jgi:predicted MPP superfamily phosphohydrolase